MRWGVEVLPPASAYHASSNWLLGSPPPVAANWTTVQNKQFEKALAEYDSDTPERWEKVAMRVPGKSSGDVLAYYRDLVEDVTQIDAGLVPLPGYYNTGCSSAAFTLDWDDGAGGADGLIRKKGRLSDQERKKGIPWTEDEHRRFLMGLKKYGKGDWRNISRNFVTTRTPTQVASHAQKYFIRLSTGGKDKRRSSIHDITTVNLPDDSKPPPMAMAASSTSHVSSAVTSTDADIKPKLEQMVMMTNNNLIIPPYGGGSGGGFDSLFNGNSHLLLQLR